MATKLGLYNGALVLIGSRKLASLSEARESKRQLDSVWDNGLIDFVLEQGMWTFASRVVKFEETDSVESQFGHQYLIELPEDHIRTMAVSLSEYVDIPYTNYREEEGYIKSMDVPLYVRYISSDVDYGGDLSKWPESFARYVEHYLALQVAESIAKFSENKMLRFEKKLQKKLLEARSICAMKQPTQFLPSGSWIRSRRGNTIINNDASNFV